jgi:hypothetical protein
MTVSCGGAEDAGFQLPARQYDSDFLAGIDIPGMAQNASISVTARLQGNRVATIEDGLRREQPESLLQLNQSQSLVGKPPVCLILEAGLKPLKPDAIFPKVPGWASALKLPGEDLTVAGFLVEKAPDCSGKPETEFIQLLEVLLHQPAGVPSLKTPAQRIETFVQCAEM